MDLVYDSYNFAWTGILVHVDEILMIVVTPRTQIARLTGPLVIERHIFEASFLRHDAARCVHRPCQEVKVLALVVDAEGLVLGSSLLGRPKVQLRRSHWVCLISLKSSDY